MEPKQGTVSSKDSNRESSWSISPEERKEWDAKVASPLSRGLRVWDLIKASGVDVTDYDMACFSLTFLGFFTTNLDELCTEEVHALIRQFNAAHYYRLTNGK